MSLEDYQQQQQQQHSLTSQPSGNYSINSISSSGVDYSRQFHMNDNGVYSSAPPPVNGDMSAEKRYSDSSEPPVFYEDNNGGGGGKRDYGAASSQRKPYASQSEIDKDRERFAGDYTSICLKNLNKKVDDSVLRDTLYAEFSRFGKFNVKIVNNRKNSNSSSGIEDTRIAFVNFNSHEEAREAKRSKMGQIFYGYPLHIEPVFRSRASSGFAPNRQRSRSPLQRGGGAFNRAPHSPKSGQYYEKPARASYSSSSNHQTGQRGFRSRSRSRSRSRVAANQRARSRSRSWTRSRSASKVPAREELKARSPARHREALDRSSSGNHLNRAGFSNHAAPSKNHSTYGRSSRSPPSAPNNYSSHIENHRRRSPSATDKRKFQIVSQDRGVGGGYQRRSRSRSRSRHAKPLYRSSKSRSRSPMTKNHYSHSSSAYAKPNFSRDRPLLLPKKEYSSPSAHFNHFQHPSREHDDRSTSSSRHRRSSTSPPPPPPPAHRPAVGNRQDSWSASASYRNANLRTPSFGSRATTTATQAGAVGHYLDDDERDATRTLFIGNLDYDIHCNDLKEIFEQYGFIEEIDIKRLTHSNDHHHSNGGGGGGTGGLKAYAFIKFHNMDMACLAKAKMNGKLIGKAECKIGYGKIQPTNCLWIAGFNSKTQVKDIESNITEVIVNYQKNGRNRSQTTERIKIDWKPGDRHGYVLTSSSEYAEEVRNQYRGKCLPDGKSDRLRIDYAEAVKFQMTPERETTEPRRRHSEHTDSAAGSRASSSSRGDENTEPPKAAAAAAKRSSLSKPAEDSGRSKKFKPSEPAAPEPAAEASRMAEKKLDEPKPLGKTAAFEKIIITTTNDSRRVDTLPVSRPLGGGVESERKAKSEGAKRGHSSATAPSPDKKPDVDSSAPSEPRSPARASPVSNDGEEPSSSNRNFNLGDEPFINSQLLNANLNSVEPIRELCEPCWSGVFVLKKNAFPTKFYMLSGNRELASKYLPVGEDSSLLRISQRLRLDSTKIDELERLLNESCGRLLQNTASPLSSADLSHLNAELTFSILIALPTELEGAAAASLSPAATQLQQQIEQNQLQHRSIHYLIQYLNQKTAAGVIPLNDDKDSLVLHAFTPNCQFSARVLKQILPGLKASGLEAEIASSSSSSPNEIGPGMSGESNEYLIIVILKP